MTLIKKKSLLSFILLFTCLISFNAVIAAERQAGKTLLVRGSVVSKRANANIPLKRRSVVYEKDEIHVGQQGRAQFRMIDQALISLQENSVLQIKKYQYIKGEPSNSALLELLSGGLRTITGAIGKGNKKAYELRTPLATIGIRGTDYEVEIVSNGMYVAVWDGVIHLRARTRNGCNILLGRSQPFMFIFIDRLGKCKGFQNVPDVFKTGHSSNVRPGTQRRSNGSFIARSGLQARGGRINPLEQLVQNGVPPLSIPANSNPANPNPANPNPANPNPANPNPANPTTSFNHNSFAIDQTRPSKELPARASVLASPNPVFKVGLDLLKNAAGGTVRNYQQSVGGYSLSWGYWGEFDSTLAGRNITSSTENGLIWATYEATDPSIVSARTGSFARFDNVTDSLMSGSAGTVSNLQVQMDVNFESGNVTNGALSANTAEETWVAVFDGKINAGDLDLKMNGASVINSDPNSSGSPRDADGFIAGDFIGKNAEAVIGAFGLSEKNDPTNHIEGVFVVEEK